MSNPQNVRAREARDAVPARVRLHAMVGQLQPRKTSPYENRYWRCWSIVRTYVYKMTVNDGGAPCVRGGLLSLAICKPVIRRVAKEGSLIFGFAGNVMVRNYPDNCLVYVAEVTKKLDGAEYYNHAYGGALRADQIYRWRNQLFERREKTANYHPEKDHLEHDLGRRDAGYPNRSVLISDKFRYFGSDGPLPQEEVLRDLLTVLTQGHRCNLSDKAVERFTCFKR